MLSPRLILLCVSGFLYKKRDSLYGASVVGSTGVTGGAAMLSTNYSA